MKSLIKIFCCIFVLVIVMNLCSCRRFIGAGVMKILGVPFTSGIKEISETLKIDLTAVEGLDDFQIRFKYPDFDFLGESEDSEISIEIIDTKNAIDLSDSKDWKKNPVTKEVDYYLETYKVYDEIEITDNYYWIVSGENDDKTDFDISHLEEWSDFNVGILNDKGILYNISFMLEFRETTKEILDYYNIDFSEIEETAYSHDWDECYAYENKKETIYDYDFIEVKLNREYNVKNLKHWHKGPVVKEIKKLLKKSEITRKLKFSDNCNYIVYGASDNEKYSYNIDNFSKWTNYYIGILDNGKKVFYDIRVDISTIDDYE